LEIDIHEAVKRNDLLYIDVRSPQEYAEASIPGAMNIPLFEDDQHHQLGIIYHKLGEQEARRLALEMVAPKLAGLTDQIVEASGNKIPFLYCQRGGMRSLSLYQVLSMTGITALRLKNGYKAYRKYINKRLVNYDLKSKLFVIHGLTGVGKTLVLKELEAQGEPIIDLEGLARHRGSVFGAVGDNNPRSQKDFDALLIEHLDRHKDSPYFVIEGEGRRIGNVYLPLFLARSMQEGEHILLTAPLEIRVKRIVDTYIQLPLNDKVLEQLKKAIFSLEHRLSNQKVEQLAAMLDKGEYYTVAELLCTDYYDHFYKDSRSEHADFCAKIDLTDIKNAAQQIIEMINNFYAFPSETAQLD